MIKQIFNIIAVLGIVAIAFLIYSFQIEPYSIAIETLEINSGKIPLGLKNKTFVFVSDIHAHGLGVEELLINRIVELNPDYLLLGGDYWEGNEKAVEKLFSGLSWKKRWRTIGVLGNHEYPPFNDDPEKVKTMMEKQGIIVLENENMKICVADGCIFIMGISPEDTIWDPDQGSRRSDPGKALEGADEDSFRIMLSHGPDYLNDYEKQDFDLVLSGHTHGRQVVIPVIDEIWTLSRYDRGKFEIVNSTLYVSRGIGGTIPIRFLAKPEITVLRFV